MCKESNLFNMKRKSYSVPVEFRVLIALRILAKNHGCDTLHGLSLVGASTCSKFFCTFVINFARLYFEHLVFVPEGEQLRKTMDIYKIRGFNGYFESIDCTHLRWNKYPRKWQNFCIGKEGYPTLAFLVVVDHNKRAMIVSRTFFGAANDKLIVKACDETKAIINGSMESVCYHLYDASGNMLMVQGAYLIADAGFLRIGCMTDLRHSLWLMQEVRWSEFLESIRKDVECNYGILKNRFRFCLGPIEVRDYVVVEAAFKCCTMLHNMIHDFDEGFHAECSSWENINWETLDSNTPDEDIEAMLQEVRDQREQDSFIPFLPAPESTAGVVQIRADNKNDYTRLKEFLITSFTKQFEMSQVYWPSRFVGWQRDALALQRIQGRIDREYFHALYGAMSTNFCYNPDTGYIDFPMGEDLLSTMSYIVGDVIAEFHGNYISMSEYEERHQAGRTRYVVYLRKDLYLDCMQQRFSGECKASLANSPYWANRPDGSQCLACIV